MTDDRSTMPKSVEALEAENAVLRARIDALESRDRLRADDDRRSLADDDRDFDRRARGEPVSRITRDRLRDVPDRSAEEVDRVARALTNAASESARNLSRAINAAADVIFQREDRRIRDEDRLPSRAHYLDESEPRGERVRRRADHVTTDDVVAGIATGLLEALDGQRSVVRRFFDAYEDEAGEQEDERYLDRDISSDRPQAPRTVIRKRARETPVVAAGKLATDPS